MDFIPPPPRSDESEKRSLHQTRNESSPSGSKQMVFLKDLTDPRMVATHGPNCAIARLYRARSRPTDGGSAGYGSILRIKTTSLVQEFTYANRRTVDCPLSGSSALTPTIMP